MDTVVLSFSVHAHGAPNITFIHSAWEMRELNVVQLKKTSK